MTISIAVLSGSSAGGAYSMEVTMPGAVFTVASSGGIATITVAGSVDAHSTPEFDRKLKETIASTKKIVLDVSKMDYIATSGLGALMAARSSGAVIALAGMNDNVKKVFTAMGFINVFKIFPSTDQARASLG